MKRTYVAAGATYGFMAVGSSLRKVTLATGVSETLTTLNRYTALCYGGDTVLYGATKSEVVSINQTTGAPTVLFAVEGTVDNIVYKDTDELYLTIGNSLLVVDTDDGAVTYINQSI